MGMQLTHGAKGLDGVADGGLGLDSVGVLSW